jgi:5'-nucleotidase
MTNQVNTPARVLTIAVSSRSLFHIEDGNEIFEKEGQAAFDEYMRSKENVPLRPGAAFPLVRKLLALNKVRSPFPRDRVEVVLLSRNSPDAGMRVMNSIAHYDLDIERSVFTQGGDRFLFAKDLGAHLFLSANPADVSAALKHGIAAATMLPVERSDDADEGPVVVVFDGDSVIFDDEADACYRANGLEAFRQHEVERAHIPLGAGPFKVFLEVLCGLQAELRKEYSEADLPLITALVTARGMPSHARVINTLRSWGVTLNKAIFCGGLPKGPLLRTLRAHIFFDDTVKNGESAASHDISFGHVPYGHGGIVATEVAAPATPAVVEVVQADAPALAAA